MARPTATDEERADQRRRLRRAAAELHAEGGPAAVSVRAVAKRAGVSTGLLYSYFANLSDLNRSLWMGPIAELGRSLAEVERDGAEPVERIGQLLDAYVAFTTTHSDTHRWLLLWVRPPNSTTDRNDDPDELMLFASLRRAIEDGQADGTIRAGEARVMAQTLWSGVHGALALPINIDTYDLADGPSIAGEMIASLVRSITTTDTITTTVDHLDTTDHRKETR
ncbi:MAG: TetR/AcrR family transcriptional regulator [Actinomycetota bacterium]